jgi:hypothetical protein
MHRFYMALGQAWVNIVQKYRGSGNQTQGKNNQIIIKHFQEEWDCLRFYKPI